MALPVLLAVDGNSLLHRAYHARAHTAYRLADGRPGWAVQGLLTQLAAAAERACARAVLVGFDDPLASRRRERWPAYKAQRPVKLATLSAQVEVAVEVLTELGVPVVVPAGLEADDVLASATTYARGIGMQTVLVTSDRDCFALLDERTRVLRLVDGGVGGSPMIDPRRLELLAGVRPDQYADLAALRGDPSDNLPGVRGVGPATAARLLAEYETAAALFADAGSGGARLRELVGPVLAQRLAQPAARAVWETNRAIMAMAADLPLGVDVPGGAGSVPLPLAAVRRVYDGLDLGSAMAVRALCPVGPRLPRPWDEDPRWQPATVRPVARFAPLRRTRTTHVQDRLF